MKAEFKVSHRGTGCFILVQNYQSFNEVANYYFSDIKYITKDYCSVGMWKLKQLKK
jgi:hypothetical protein